MKYNQGAGASLTQKELMDRLLYDPETGIFKWLKIAPNQRERCERKDKVAGSVNDRGYVKIRINGAWHSAHRLAWLYMVGQWPSEDIDHINLNKSDNRWDNLRAASPMQNRQNRTIPKRNKTGFLGVAHHNRLPNLFIAQYHKDGRNHVIGFFKRPEEAHAAYLKAIAYRGNFIPLELRQKMEAPIA